MLQQIDVSKFTELHFWTEFGILTATLLIVMFFLLRYIKKPFVTIFLLLINIGLIASIILDAFLVFAVLLAVYLIGTLMIVFINSNEFRTLIANPLRKEKTFLGFKVTKRKARRSRKIYDREAVFHEIESAVDYLSKTKTGALITFEKNMALDEIIRNGQIINAPVNTQLLLTIFYKGTALHDGAVVIRDNMILAASVYYTASTKPLTGKVGSRHRAALGISEISDSVTIVVSEETGRISLAYKGSLQPVAKEKFLRVLTDYMEMEDAEI